MLLQRVSYLILCIIFQAPRRNKIKTKEAFEKLVQDTVVSEDSISDEDNVNSASTSSDENMMYRIVEDILDVEELASVRQNMNIESLRSIAYELMISFSQVTSARR
jgi:hypothetical protein